MADLHADRLKLYDQFTDAANKYKNNKDLGSYTSSRKKAENDLKNVGQAIGDLQVELKSSNADIAEKVCHRCFYIFASN
ncbi:unnamed protein product [Gongylonema pulchrum]|uniref:Ribophorin I n=1 Tax=Gongylonema pulchrum TaxID=637853 RepID=A0A3P7PR23_9BILA|nr:unnamed protein product [Gongylonema pulchrum]